MPPHSKKLRQAIDLELDTQGMRGPVRKRDVADKVMRTVPTRQWAYEDERDARYHYLMAMITEQMDVNLPDAIVQPLLAKIPKRWHDLFDPMPRWVCIVNGPNAEHILTIRATPDDFLADSRLKRELSESVENSGKRSLRRRRMLLDLGVNCLADL